MGGIRLELWPLSAGEPTSAERQRVVHRAMAHADCISWLDNPSVGSRFSGAIRGIGVNTAVVMHSLLHIGIPEDLLLVGETATIYFVPVVLKDDRPTLLPDRHTRLVPHAVQDNTGRYLKEACAGIGCIGIGPSEPGSWPSWTRTTTAVRF